jgi:hypothetical protein
MTKKLVWIWIGTLAGTVAACGQDLALPTRADDDPDAAAGPVDGTTGAAGEPGESNKPGKLVTIDQSAYGVGGAGGGKLSSNSNGRGGNTTAGGVAGGNGRAPEGGTAEGGSAGEPPVVVPTAQLLFSEYVEGSKSNKALEIFALSSGSLEGCELQTYSNGKTDPSRLALHGSLETAEVTTLCTKDLAEAEPLRCARSTSLLFNGDDALALSCNGVLQDTFGEIGVDPGESWGTGATVDHTLQRRCSVTHGRVDLQPPFAIDAEWITFGVDTFSDLGKRSCD